MIRPSGLFNRQSSPCSAKRQISKRQKYQLIASFGGWAAAPLLPLLAYPAPSP